MRICVLTHSFPRYINDPTAPFMTGVCKGLSEAGNTVFVLAPDNPFYVKKIKNNGYKLIIYRYIFPPSLHLLGYSQTLVNDKKFKIRVFLLSPLFFFFCFINLLRLVKKENVEVISAHWILPNGFIAALVKRFTQVKVVSTLPGSDVYVAQKNSLLRYMALFAADNSDGITSNSIQLKDDLVTLGAKIKKFKPIIYGVDATVFKPDRNKRNFLRKSMNISGNTVVILGVGRLVEKKGFLYLVKAAKDVIHTNSHILFIIVGDGDQKSLLQAEVKKLRIEKYIRFPGKIDYSELVSYYNMADIFILPSVRDSEGNLDDQSVAAVEAMSCGKAVVTTDFPGYRMVIENNKDGFLVPEKDSKKISQVLSKLVSSPKLRKTSGQAARRKVLEQFTWGKIGKTYTDFFQSL